MIQFLTVYGNGNQVGSLFCFYYARVKAFAKLGWSFYILKSQIKFYSKTPQILTDFFFVAPLTEDFCGVEPITHPPTILEQRPPPIVDEEKVRKAYHRTDSAILGGKFINKIPLLALDSFSSVFNYLLPPYEGPRDIQDVQIHRSLPIFKPEYRTCTPAWHGTHSRILLFLPE